MCYSDWGIRSSKTSLVMLCNLVAFFNFAKGNEQHIPPETDTVVRFPPEHVARFLRLCNLGNNGCHKICYT